MPDLSKLKPEDYGGPRRVTQAEIKEPFQDGWRYYIRQATLESRMEPSGVYGWLSSIIKM